MFQMYRISQTGVKQKIGQPMYTMDAVCVFLYEYKRTNNLTDMGEGSFLAPNNEIFLLLFAIV